MSEEIESKIDLNEAKNDAVDEVTEKEPIEDSPDWLDIAEDMNTQTCMQSRYCFWYMSRASSKAAANYKDSIKKVASFQTIEHFWRVYDHLIRPKDHKSTTIDYHLFRHGISPVWEDSQNIKGGKWIVRLKKGLASKYWEELVLAIIGEQFDVGQEICGAVISIRGGEDIISVWNKTADNLEATNKLRDQIRRILQLPAYIPIEFKKHEDSLSDKSSFRNTVVYRAPSGRDGSNYKPQQSGERDRGDRDRNDRPYRSDRSYNQRSDGSSGGSNNARERASSGDIPSGFQKNTSGVNWQQQQQQQRTERDRDRDREGGSSSWKNREGDRGDRNDRENSWSRRDHKDPDSSGGWTRGRATDSEASDSYKSRSNNSTNNSTNASGVGPNSTRPTRPRPYQSESTDRDRDRKTPSSNTSKTYTSGTGSGTADRWTRGRVIEPTAEKQAET